MSDKNEASLWDAGVTQVHIPGPPGPPGPPPTLQAGTVTSGVVPNVQITEVSPGVYSLNFTLPQGEQGLRGLPGEAARFTSVATQTLNPGIPASVEITGQGPNYGLIFRIPRGAKGDQGPQGFPGEASLILSGSTAPTNDIGVDGDWYFKTSSPLTLYGPKEGGVWPSPGVTIQGEPGQNAVNPNFIIGDVVPGPEPKVTVSGVYPNLTLDFELVKGEPGNDGEDGAPGLIQSVVPGTDISVDNTDPANPVVSFSGSIPSPGGQVDSVVAGDGISVDATDPANPVVTNTAPNVQADWEAEEGPEAILNKPGNVVESIVPGSNINIDNTDPKNPVISSTGGGGGGDFVIEDLPSALLVSGADYIPIAHNPAEVEAKFWRFIFLQSVDGRTTGTFNRLYEIQFRELPGVPEPMDPEANIYVDRWESDQIINAIDNDTSTYMGASVSVGNGRLFTVEYVLPKKVSEVAIYYGASGNARNHSPGTFAIEYSADGVTWNTWLSVENYEPDEGAGFNLFSTPDASYEQYKLTVASLQNYIVGDIATALDLINGEVVP